MPSVFLSHSSVDKAFVRNLAAALEEGGEIKVWLDEGEIAPGDNIVTKIAEGLESNFVLFVMSPEIVAELKQETMTPGQAGTLPARKQTWRQGDDEAPG